MSIFNPDKDRAIWQVKAVLTNHPMSVIAAGLTYKQAKTTARGALDSINVISAFVERMPGK